MRALRSCLVLAVSGLLAVGSHARAQDAAQAPVGEQPAAFPDGARIAFVNFGRVASISKKGQSLTKRLEELSAAKSSEVAARARQLEALKTKLDQSESLLNDDALKQVRRQFERAQVDFQRTSQDAQDEVQQLQRQLRDAFAADLLPIVERVAAEKSLWAVFSEPDAGAVWKLPALDLSDEIARRLDAADANPSAKP